MSTSFGPIDIDCDALPYPIVEACNRLGFRSAPDVRWCHMSHFQNTQDLGANVIGGFAWLLPFHKSRSRNKSCTCGNPLPTLEQFRFMFPSGKQDDYLLGQCYRCNTIFWEEVSSNTFPTNE